MEVSAGARSKAFSQREIGFSSKRRGVMMTSSLGPSPSRRLAMIAGACAIGMGLVVAMWPSLSLAFSADDLLGHHVTACNNPKVCQDGPNGALPLSELSAENSKAAQDC